MSPSLEASRKGAWLRTSDAVVELGCSRATLLRRKQDGYFQRGDHWITVGPHPTAPVLWNIDAVRTQMARWSGPDATGHSNGGGL